MTVKTCSDCKKKSSCKEPCVFVEELLRDVEVPEDWRMHYVPEPKAVFLGHRVGSGGHPSGMVRTVLHLDDAVTETAMYKEIESLKILRPLIGLDIKTRAVYIEANYFGTPKEEIARAFKIKRRWVYECLRNAEAAMG